MKYILTIIVFVVLFTGCGASVYHLKVVDVQTNEIFLTFAKEDSVKVGDVFVLYSTMQSHSGGGGHQGHGGGSTSPMKEVIGYIKVTEVLDATHAKVEILSGRVDEHVMVERAGSK